MKMKNNEVLEKSSEEDEDSVRSSFNRLPDEILLQILRKLTDLKTLCFCYLVSRRFSSIVLQVDAISFTAPLLLPPNSAGSPKNLFTFLVNGVVLKPIHLLRRLITPTRPLPPIISSFYGDSFRSAISFSGKFKRIRSLSIQLPSSTHKGISNDCLFKWMVKFSNRIESFTFLSPNSISKPSVRENELREQEEDTDSFKQKVHIAFQCLKDVIVRHRMLLYFVKDHPLLEEITITDSGKRGRLYLRGEKIGEVRDWIESSVKPQLKNIEVPVRVSQCYVPVLEMPVSGFSMKGATLVVMEMTDGGGEDDVVIGEDGFEDEEAAAYGEAVMEIMLKHKSRMKRLL